MSCFDTLYFMSFACPIMSVDLADGHAGDQCRPEAYTEGEMGRTLTQVLDESFAKFANRPAVRVLGPSGEGGLAYQPISYGELEQMRNQLAAGLVRLGMSKGQRVGILTDGGLEPLLVFLAGDLLGVCSVPLCLKSTPDVVRHSIEHSQISHLVVDEKGAALWDQLEPLLQNRPRIIHTGADSQDFLAWQRVLESGAGQPVPEVEVGSGDESKVLYTSGSSGMPKGVIQTHGNIVANLEAIWQVLSEKEPVRIFKSAPDYHSMGILNIYYPLAKGWVLDLARSPDRVLVDIRHSEPDAFLTVPLILDKVYGNVRKEIEAGGLKGKLIARSAVAKRRIKAGRASATDRLIQATLGKRIIAKIRDALSQRVGPNLNLLIVGSAKADPEAMDFFQDVLDITTFEGYGATECAPLISTNHLGGRKSGSVGRALFEVQLRKESGERVGYANPENGVVDGSGQEAAELWVHGPNVMPGYLDDEAQTSKVLVFDDEGKKWYRTGDLFSLDDEGFLTFRGRLGRQFKLRNGEFVNPELLERHFARASLVEHVVICGDQSRNFPLPLVAVDEEEIAKQEELANLADDSAPLRCHPLVAERVREQLLAEADLAGLPVHERPQKIVLLPEALSEEAGTLTRGLKKIVPAAVINRHAKLIEDAYATL